MTLQYRPHRRTRTIRSLLLISLFYGASSFYSQRLCLRSTRRKSPLYYLSHDELEGRQPAKDYYAVDDVTQQPQTDLVESSKRSSSKPIKPHAVAWNTRYNELLQFKAENGHCMVPQNYPPNPKLGHWVMAQRRSYALISSRKCTELQGNRIALLEKVGFVFRAKRLGPRTPNITSKFLAMERSGHCQEIDSVDDFVRFMIDKSGVLTEDEIREAWRIRFRIYQ